MKYDYCLFTLKYAIYVITIELLSCVNLENASSELNIFPNYQNDVLKQRTLFDFDETEKYELYRTQQFLKSKDAKENLLGYLDGQDVDEMSCFRTKIRAINSTASVEGACIISKREGATFFQDSFSNVSVVSCIIFMRKHQLGCSFAKTGSFLQFVNISLASQMECIEIDSFISTKSNFPTSNSSVSALISSSSFSHVLISSTFFDLSTIGSILELHSSTFFNISAKPNEKDHKLASHLSSCSSTIDSCLFDHTCGVYDGVIIPSISIGVFSLGNYNSSHISCSRWSNKLYANETLERVELDTSNDKDFSFESCEWDNLKGEEPGQCIFVKAQVHDFITLSVKWCWMKDITSDISSGSAIYAEGNIAATFENTLFQHCKSKKDHDSSPSAGTVHVISSQQPVIKQCFFQNCLSFSDACVIYEHKTFEAHQRKSNFCRSCFHDHQKILKFTNIESLNSSGSEIFGKQSKINEKSKINIDEIEFLCIQSTFLSCASLGMGGGIYLKDAVENAFISECVFSDCRSRCGGALYFVIADTHLLEANRQFVGENPCCVHASYFSINGADDFGSDVYIESESDYDDGLKFFSLCKTSKHNDNSVVQKKLSEPDKNLRLLKSFEVAQRAIVLDSSAQFRVACGSTAQIPCQTINQALEHISPNESVKLLISSDATTFVTSMCTIKFMELEVCGNGGGTMVLHVQNNIIYIDSLFHVTNSSFSIRNLTILYAKEKSNSYRSIFYSSEVHGPSSITMDHVTFKYDEERNVLHNLQESEGSNRKPDIFEEDRGFYIFHLTKDSSLLITDCDFSNIPRGTVSSIVEKYTSPTISVINSVFQNISTYLDFSVFISSTYLNPRSITLRNVTASLITSQSDSGGFMSVSFQEHSGLVVTNCSFKSCTAVNFAGALKCKIFPGSPVIFDNLLFSNNVAKKYCDMILLSKSLLDINFQAIFSFVDQSIDATQIGCFDELNYKNGMSIAELLQIYYNIEIYVSSSRGTDFTRCGTYDLPCRSLTYGWTHLQSPNKLIVIDLALLTQPISLNEGIITSTSKVGIIGKVEVNMKYSDNWKEVINLNGSVSFTKIDFVLCAMTNRTENAVTITKGVTLWKKVTISFSPMKEEESINYKLFNVINGGLMISDVIIKGENSIFSDHLFSLSLETNLLHLNNLIIENVRNKVDLICIFGHMSSESTSKDRSDIKNILISNFSRLISNNLTDSKGFVENGAENLPTGRILQCKGSAQQKLEICNSSFTSFSCTDDYEFCGGCIYWSGKNRDKTVSSVAAEDDKEEEKSSELLFKNCTFSNNKIDSDVYFDKTKGGAIYLEFHSQAFPFIFQEVSMFKNQADKGLDIFFRCPSFTNAEESKKFGINFQHSFWVEQNSIAAESIEDGKIVDYLEFITYRNTEIFVSGLEDSTKKCQNKHISSSSLPSSSLSPDDFSMYAKGRVVNQAVGWDIFYCGKEDSPCHTVNYAITHLISVPFTTKQIEQHKSLHLLSFAPNLRASREENDGKQFTLHIIGMPAVYNFVTWNSLLVDGDTDDACLLLESSKQEASEKETIKQLDETRKDCDKINFHVTIKGMCMLCNTKVKIGSDLPVNCLFFINDESNFSVENCHISSVNEWATMPTVFKIQTGTLLCSLMSIDKVLFGSYSFFIDCSELDDESKVNVRLNLCILSNITVPERNSLIAFSIKGQNISANNENQHIFESSSFSLSKSSSNLNQIPQANSSSSLSPNTSQSAADSSTPLHIPLQFISTNISLSSQMPGNSLFLTANGRSCVEIRGCNFLFMNAPSSAEEAQERTEYAVCQWNCSFISFCDCTAYVRNTTFRTRLAGAIYAENSYLLIDVASLKENSAGLTEFPSVAHNIICHRKGSKKEGKGVIELVSSDGSSANSEFDVQRGENRQLNHYGQHEVKSDEEMPDNFWIESNDCSLLGFPGAVISSLFTPLPENVSKVRNGEGFVVTITGKYLLNCYLAMVLLINQTNGGKATKELIEISSSTELTSNHEKAISAYFPKDAVEQRSGANVYVALKFSDEHALKADAMTIPLCLTEGKEPEKIDLIATIVSVVATAAIVCVGIAILLILLRRKRKKKMTSAERREKQSLLSSINSEFICVTTKRADNKTLTYTIYDYGTTTKSIDIPSDMQDPFFED